MKTKEEIFEDAGNAEDFAPKVEVYSKTHAFQRADEYAEEYAKALLQWMNYSSRIYATPEEWVDAFKNSAFFKESLKK